MTAAFTLSALRCACGSSDVICVDPGSDAEMDPVFHIVTRRPIPARGWCGPCVDAFAPLMPREGKRNG
jgi:hypothetical protein